MMETIITTAQGKPGTASEFSECTAVKTVGFRNNDLTTKGRFPLGGISARNDIFFCLLTTTLRQLVFKQKKCRSARKIPPSGKWP